MTRQLSRIEDKLDVLLRRTNPGPLTCKGERHPHMHGESAADWPLAKPEQQYGPLCYIEPVDGSVRPIKAEEELVIG